MRARSKALFSHSSFTAASHTWQVSGRVRVLCTKVRVFERGEGAAAAMTRGRDSVPNEDESAGLPFEIYIYTGKSKKSQPDRVFCRLPRAVYILHCT